MVTNAKAPTNVNIAITSVRMDAVVFLYSSCARGFKQCFANPFGSR
jgi:hypothetical protein